jgi:hypothetical protein
MNNLLSFSSVKLDLFTRDGARLKPASGFVLEAGSQHYLVTNLHVLSNGSTVESAPQGSSPKPYTLKASIHNHGGDGENRFPLSMGTRQKITLRLYNDSDTPVWLECQPKTGAEPPADIAAIPFHANRTSTLIQTMSGFSLSKQESLPALFQSKYWSRISAIPLSAIDTDVEYVPSDAVHVIGYPHGWAPQGSERTSSAFWRTSFIASEIYEAGMARSDTFFIDPCAPEGMTGSPVVGMKQDRMKLLGVYSDRSTVEFGANAGMVYGALLLKELIGVS